MTGKQRYAVFLKTEFWKGLSAEKRRQVGECERCGELEGLQAHHKVYPADWFDSRLEHLEVLCRRCHRAEHGIVGAPAIMLYRGDLRFSLFAHWIGYLCDRFFKRRWQLKGRELRYLEAALELYPPEPGDTCMEFHVRRCLEWNEKLKGGLI
jgi:hypothetical protein